MKNDQMTVLKNVSLFIISLLKDSGIFDIYSKM